MDKSCQSSGGDSTSTTNPTTTSSSSSSNNRDQYLKHLHKINQKISKPITTHPTTTTTTASATAITVKKLTTFDEQTQSQTSNQQLPQTHQPPVYNINKNDFRDVVQKLTGSPAHDRCANPPIQSPKPPSSRLHKIRPPPLAQISNRPLPMLSSAAPAQNPSYLAPPSSATNGNYGFGQRPVHQPLSPLPPFPSVQTAVESPISAYMRFLQSSMSTVDSDPKRFSPLVSPRWNSFGQSQLHQPHQQAVPPQQHNISQSSSVSIALPQFPPASPLPFGCLPSPRSPYPLLSPSLLFSPTGLPVSPTLRVPSPRWNGH